MTAAEMATYGCGLKIPQSNYLGLVKHVEMHIRFSNVNWGDRDSEPINNAIIPPMTAVFDGNNILVWESVRRQVLKGASVAERCDEVKELLRKFGRLRTLIVVTQVQFDVENRERVNKVNVDALFALKDVNAENIGVKIQFVRNGAWTEGIAMENGDWVGGLKSFRERRTMRR